jgi:hypothetical protein
LSKGVQKNKIAKTIPPSTRQIFIYSSAPHIF